MAFAILVKFDFVVAKEMTEGPAPEIVTPNAPAFKAFFLTELNPGIRCALEGSTMISFMELPISSESFLIKPVTIAAAFDKLITESERSICLGMTLLDTLVFF